MYVTLPLFLSQNQSLKMPIDNFWPYVTLCLASKKYKSLHTRSNTMKKFAFTMIAGLSLAFALQANAEVRQVKTALPAAATTSVQGHAYTTADVHPALVPTATETINPASIGTEHSVNLPATAFLSPTAVGVPHAVLPQASKSRPIGTKNF
jgi:hypothetical protein